MMVNLVNVLLDSRELQMEIVFLQISLILLAHKIVLLKMELVFAIKAMSKRAKYVF